MLLLKRLSLLALLCWLPLMAQGQWFSSADSQDDFLPVSEAFQPSAWHDGDTLYIGIDIAEHYYLYRHQLALEAPDADVELGDPVIPEGTFKHDDFIGDAQVFRDQLVFEAPLGEHHDGPLSLQLRFQGCADKGLCYPPEQVTLQASESSPPAAFNHVSETAPRTTARSSQTVEVPFSEASPQSEDSRFSQLIGETSLPLALGLFFIAGIGLTFTPCVLPMIPILSAIVVGQSPTRGRAFVLSLSYVLGMAITYAVVGVLMGLFGAGLNLQAHLQSAPVLIGFAILFCMLGAAMLGAFDIRLSPRLATCLDGWQTRAQRSGPLGLAVAGALSVLIVSPCVTAPLAGALVFISTTGNAPLGGAVLLAMGAGMGLPLLLVGTFGAALLPRSGPWMNGVKIAFGLLLLGVAIWMIERLVPAPVSLLLWAALAIGSALALGALTTNQPQGWPRARQTLGLLLLAWGATLVIGAAQGGHDPLRPLARQASHPTGQVASNLQFQRVTSLAELEAALDDASQRDLPAFVHFTAEWCIACKLMERDVYPDPAVASVLNQYALIEVDVTDTSDQSRQVLDHFNLFGPPSLLFFSHGEEVRSARIQGEVNATTLADHLAEFSQWYAKG